MSDQRSEESSNIGGDGSPAPEIALPSQRSAEKEPNINLPAQHIDEPTPKCKSKLYRDQQTPFVALIPLVIFSMMGAFFDASVANLALPTIQEDFNKSKSVTQWIQTLVYIAQVGFSIPMAKVAEKIGIVTALMLFSTVQGITQLSCFFCKDFALYCVLKFLYGVASAGAIPSRSALMRCLAPPSKAQSYIQLQSIVAYILNVPLPIISSALIKVEWRYGHIVCAVSCFIAALLLIPIQQPKMQKKDARFDIWGTLLLFLGATAIDLSFTIAASNHWLFFSVLIVIGVGCFVGLYFVEQKHEDPVLPIKLLKNPVVDYVLINIIQFYNQSGVLYLIPQTLSFYGKDPMVAGSLNMVVNVVGMIISICIVFLTKRFLNRSLLIFSGIFALTFLLATIVCVSNIPLSLLLLVIYQFSCTFAGSIIFPMTMISVPRQYANQISAIPTTGRTIGQSMTLCVTSMILQTLTTQKQEAGMEPAEAWSFALRIEFTIYALLQFLMIILVVLRTGHTPSEQNKKGFNPKKVRIIKGLETDIEQRNSLLQKPTKVDGEIE